MNDINSLSAESFRLFWQLVDILYVLSVVQTVIDNREASDSEKVRKTRQVKEQALKQFKLSITIRQTNALVVPQYLRGSVCYVTQVSGHSNTRPFLLTSFPWVLGMGKQETVWNGKWAQVESRVDLHHSRNVCSV